jgi:hypothetical protein
MSARRAAWLLAAGALLCAAPATAQFADLTPGLNLPIGPIDLSLHGYFRAPLRLAWRSRGMTGPGESHYNVHTPWLVDDDYFNSGFAYTRIQESDWSELFFSVGNQHVTGTVAFMGSLFSDWAQPLLERQWGMAQAFVTFDWRWEPRRLKVRLRLKGGSFWDRFGWLESYDTYLFGRTHQMGAQYRLDFTVGKVTVFVIHGLGVHLESIENNQGLTLLNYLNAGVAIDERIRAAFYVLDAMTADKRQLQQRSRTPTSGSMDWRRATSRR